MILINKVYIFLWSHCLIFLQTWKFLFESAFPWRKKMSLHNFTPTFAEIYCYCYWLFNTYYDYHNKTITQILESYKITLYWNVYSNSNFWILLIVKSRHQVVYFDQTALERNKLIFSFSLGNENICSKLFFF